MTSNPHQNLCPVCGTEVKSADWHKTFRGIEFWFCSAHCQTRFTTRPHLYVGDPQHGKSVKQQGKQVMKEHRLRLKQAPESLAATLLQRELERLVGLKKAVVDGSHIDLTYDLLLISLIDIERAIEQAYGDLSNKIADSIARGIVHQSEECELDNLAHLANEGYLKRGQ